MVYQDDAAFLRDLLTDKWTKANSDEIKPGIQKVISLKRKRFANDQDFIAIYNVTSTFKDNAIGNLTLQKRYRSTIDIYTTRSDIRLYKMVSEVIRILNNYAVLKGDYTFDEITYSYSGILSMVSIKELSNRSSGLFRQSLDVVIEDNDDKTTG